MMKKLKLFILAVLISNTVYSQYSKLQNFAAKIKVDYPYGDLLFDGTFLYGMSSVGGADGLGLIFRVKPDGSELKILLEFTGDNGSFPNGGLISDGTFLYGMTRRGGRKEMGVIFKIKTDGTGYLTLLSFTGINGSNPQGSLISDGSFLYGMTYDGGKSDFGVIFKIKRNGTGFLKLLDFTGENGTNPTGSLLSDGTFLYGMTPVGGLNALGNIFRILLSFMEWLVKMAQLAMVQFLKYCPMALNMNKFMTLNHLPILEEHLLLRVLLFTE